MSRLVSRLQDPFFLADGGRPLYFRNGGIDDLDAAQDEVLWIHLVIEALIDTRSHVDQFKYTMSQIAEHIDAATTDEIRQRSKLLATTREKFISMSNDCDQWLIDFASVDPIPRLQKLADAGANIVRAHVAACKRDLDREMLIRFIRSERGRATLEGVFETQVRSLLCEAPDECKDVDLCERLLDWHRCF
ncbi:hypothetical protein A1O3_07556 [Capronia epimyces CBS 606.96]|uniref:Uncharacterized protein n=1 Tax=Capronia epimyces CBS 606.96 TaxID=1182542 RepID=W9XW91_9EURO|nr:uncharacterized protein A1O3_07556 [Capronia epimyces CBS 606.96]EXJ81266.1 hypothetical protein A1O3_07556 [Capronia epimyces CBS 606.96]